MKVKSVSISGFRKVKSATYNLDGSCYIHGPNGSGKSTILSAVQLALTGSVPGTQKRASDVLKHSNGSRIDVRLMLEGDNGDTVEVTRTIRKKGSGATSNVEVKPDDLDLNSVVKNIELPVFNWPEFASMTSNKLKDWFVQFMPSSNCNVDWKAELESCLPEDASQAQRSMVDEYTSRICSEFSVDTSDQVSKANAMLKRDRSYVKAVLDEKSSTLSNLTRYESYCVPDLQQANKQLQLDESSLESAKREMNSAVREYENAQRQEAEYQRKLYEFNQVTSLDPGQDAIERTRTSLDELRCKGKSLECTLLGLEKDEQTVHDRLTNVEQRTGFVKGSLSLCSKDGLSDCQDGTCPYTRKHCKELDEAVKGRVDHVAKLNDRLKALEDERKSVEQEIESVRRMARDAHTELRNVSEAAAKLESDLSRMRKLHESALQAHRPERTSESTTDSILSDLKNRAAEACDRVNDLRARVEKSRNAVKSASMLEELYGQRDELEGKYDVLGSWIKLTGENGLQSSLASKQFEKVQEAITESVKSLFGDEAECFFDVRNKANSFSFGVKREGKYVPYNLLSTGERCLLSLAFMRYICANSDSPLKVILVDDMLDNLDDGNFKKAIAYIEQCTDVQIIAAGVLPVKSELVNVIEL